MTNDDWADTPPGAAAVDYAHLIIDRVSNGMPSDPYEVDWANAPLTVTDHRSAQLTLLAEQDADPDVAMRDEPSSRLIGEVCRSAYSIHGARMTVNLNDRPEVHTRVDSIKWARGAASGGGRYCVNFYLVHSGDTALPAGVYSYSVIADGWERLQRHDRSGELRDIQHHGFDAVSYLVLTINYWRSAFKYNDFAYQATAMDIGTVVGAERELFGADVRGTWDFEVDEQAIAELLGIDPEHEGVYAVQGWGARPAADTPQPTVLPRPMAPASWQRDRGVISFETTRALQRDMAVQHPDWSRRGLLRPVLSMTSRDVRERGRRRLQERETSFGRFSGEAVDGDAVDALLVAGRLAAIDATSASPYQPDLTYLVYVSDVTGMSRGLYIDRAGGLELVQDGDQADFLESTYFLHNYMGRRAACTLILCAPVVAMAQHHGVRGYRLTNAMVGAACQSLLTSAQAIGVGTGTALGFDAAAHAAHARLDSDEIAPMLMVMLGVDQRASGRIHMTLTREAAS